VVARHSRMLPLATPAPDFSLPDPAGRLWSLDAFSGSRALLVAFLCNHCRYVKHVLDGFVAFAREYGPKGLAIAAINPNDSSAYADDAPEPMARIAAEKGFPFPYLIDATQRTALDYEAICTPDFFLFDGKRRLAYRGRFDASSPGKAVPVSGAELRAAVDALLAGRPIGEQTASIGCSIKWKPGNAPEWA
jgi:peroxiredoxin